MTALMVVLGMALLGALFASTVAAAPTKTDRSIDDRVASQETVCKDLGGTPETYYEFDDDGNLVFAQVSCAGGKLDTRTCINLPTTLECFQFGKLVRPTESVVPGQRPDTAAPVENPRQTLPAVDGIAVPPGGVAEDPTGDDQARIVDPAEACRALGGTANVIEQGSRVPVEIRCTGGTLDDMICYGTICDYFRGSAGSEEDPTAPSSGGIVFVEPVSLDDLDRATGDSVTPDLAEDPTAGETVTISNQSDPTATGTTVVLWCRALGGKETVIEDRTVGSGLQSVFVRCTGGLLDGLACDHHVSGSLGCWFGSVTPEEGIRVTPAAGIEAISEEPGEAAGDTGVAPGVAEDPTGTDTFVIANQSGSPVDNAAVLAAMCKMAGGTATVGETRTAGRGLENVTVSCRGGLLDGMECEHGATYDVCMIFRSAVPEDPRVTPAGIEVSTEDAPTETTAAEPTVAAPDDRAEPTVAPSEVPVEPTTVPTEMPVEPTAAPTEEPGLPTVPTDDNTAPPGEAEEPEPTPTEVVLL